MGVYSVVSVAIVIMSSIVLLYVLNKNNLLSKKIIHSIIIGSVSIMLMSLFFPYIVGYLMNFPSGYDEASGFRLGISSAVIITFFFYMLATLFISIGISRLISNNSMEENYGMSKASPNKVSNMIFKWIHRLSENNLKPQNNIQGLDAPYSPKVSTLENAGNNDLDSEIQKENVNQQGEISLEKDIPQETANNFQDIDLLGAAKQDQNILEKPVDTEQNIDTMGIENVNSENVQSDEKSEIEPDVVYSVLEDNVDVAISDHSENSDKVIELNGDGDTTNEEFEDSTKVHQEMIDQDNSDLDTEEVIITQDNISEGLELPEQPDTNIEVSQDIQPGTGSKPVDADIEISASTDSDFSENIEDVIDIEGTDNVTVEDNNPNEDTSKVIEDHSTDIPEDLEIKLEDRVDTQQIEADDYYEADEIELQKPEDEYEEALEEVAATEQIISPDMDALVDSENKSIEDTSDSDNLNVTCEEDLEKSISEGLDEIDENIYEMKDNIEEIRENIEELKDNIEENITKIEEYQVDVNDFNLDNNIDEQAGLKELNFADEELAPIDSDESNVEELIEDSLVEGIQETSLNDQEVKEEDIIKEEPQAINTIEIEQLENDVDTMNEMMDEELVQMAANEGTVSAEPLILDNLKETDENNEANTKSESSISMEQETQAALLKDKVEPVTQLDMAEAIDNYIEEAFKLKSEGDLEGALVSYMYALERKPEDKLVFWVILDTCVLYKQLGKVDLARDVLNGYLEEYGDVMDESIRIEIEKNLL